METLYKRKISKDVKKAIEAIPRLMKNQKTSDEIILNLFDFNLYATNKQVETAEILEFNFKKFYKNHFADYIYFNKNYLDEDEIIFTVRRFKDV